VSAIDWTDVDWWDFDAADPRFNVRGFRYWRYYAEPVMTRPDGKEFAPREFRAPTIADAERILQASPQSRGHITYWSERTQKRITVAEVRVS
jgi:hypothetical protein